MGHHRGTCTGDDCHVGLFGFILSSRSIVVSITVERSRKCWDYCFTLLFLHLVLTMVSHVCSVALSQVGVPDQADVVVCFWICYVVVADDLYDPFNAFHCLAERLCQRREMEDIPVEGL